MSDVNIIEQYRALMASILKDRMTDDERVIWLNQLAEMRAGYEAGLWAEEKATGIEQAPSKSRLVWGKEGGAHYLAPAGVGVDGSYYSTAGRYAFRFPGGGLDDDRHQPVNSIAEGLRIVTEWARADGYDVPDHPDAPTLPHGLRTEDGWIPWGGGKCPCPDWPKVEYMQRDSFCYTGKPKSLDWAHNSQLDCGDIIAYRRYRNPTTINNKTEEKEKTPVYHIFS